jgi:tetratricopeptide (TPR) repeat protein
MPSGVEVRGSGNLVTGIIEVGRLKMIRYRKLIFATLAVTLLSNCRGAQSQEVSVAAPADEMPAFDSLWNYNDPAASESRFRELLPQLRSGDASKLAELLTQISRAQGLQQKFEEARATLDEADALIQPNMPAAKVRSLLERGRLLNSSKKRDESVAYFKESLELAQAAGLEFYAADAAHMLGIVTKDEESLRWNEEAMKIAENAKLPGLAAGSVRCTTTPAGRIST